MSQDLIPMPKLIYGRYHNGQTSEACDMIQGPCICGAWHHFYEWDAEIQGIAEAAYPNSVFNRECPNIYGNGSVGYRHLKSVAEMTHECMQYSDYAALAAANAKLREDYEGTVRKFDACRGALARTLALMGGDPHEMLNDDMPTWHEWLSAAIDTRIMELKADNERLAREREGLRGLLQRASAFLPTGDYSRLSHKPLAVQLATDIRQTLAPADGEEKK